MAKKKTPQNPAEEEEEVVENGKVVVRSQMRVPKEVHARLREAAGRSGRTMNAELVYRLKLALSVIDGLPEERLVDPEQLTLRQTLDRLFHNAAECAEIIDRLREREEGG